MRHALVFAQSPPAQVPLPFFLAAPWFAAGAFIVFAITGPGLALSRWQGGAIAAVHLFALGYLAPVMMAAILQMGPVLTGKPPLRSRRQAHALRAALFPGVLLFAFGLAMREPHALHLSFFLLAVAVLLFLAGALRGTNLPEQLRTRGPGRGILLALAGMAVTVTLGLRLLAGHGWESISLPRHWTDIHAGWAMLGWITPLIMTAGNVVIPMFQQAPAMPAWSRRLAPAVFTGMLLATFPFTRLPGLLLACLAAVAFAILVLHRQHARRSSAPDATVVLFRNAMFSLLAATALFLWMMFAGRTALLETLVVTLFLAGFAGGCVMGMSMKIVPFLARFHLQRDVWELSLPALNIPSFKRLLPEGLALPAARMHFAGMLLFAAALPLAHSAGFRLAMTLLAGSHVVAGVALLRTVFLARRLRKAFRATAFRNSPGKDRENRHESIEQAR